MFNKNETNKQQLLTKGVKIDNWSIKKRCLNNNIKLNTGVNRFREIKAFHPTQ